MVRGFLATVMLVLVVALAGCVAAPEQLFEYVALG